MGTNLAWVGPKTIRGHIVPTISAAATAAARTRNFLKRMISA